MKKLKIATYYPWIHLKGGVERSMVALFSRSHHDWTIFTSRYEPENTFSEFKDFKVVQIGEASARRDMVAVLKSALNIFTLKLPLDDFDAYCVWCDGLGPLTMFRNDGKPSLCICATPLRPVYDPVYAAEALSTRKPLARVAFRLFRRAFGLVDRLAWARFDGVVAISREVQERIVRNRLFPADYRMILRHPGIDVIDAPADVSYEPFFLVSGRISWTKNVQLAIDAFIKSGLPRPWRLVIAGFVDRKNQAYFAELKQKADAHGRIEFVVSPSDEALNRLYETAYAVLFTPLNEDWGMTPLEGMLRAKPVVANASGGPLESVADGVTGWLLRPEVDEWAALLRRIADDPGLVYEFGRNARQHVERYDWRNFVAGVDALVEATVCPSGVDRPAVALAPNASSLS